jgi:hypothetical protein
LDFRIFGFVREKICDGGVGADFLDGRVCCELFVAVDSVEMSMSLDRLDDLVLLI